MPGIGGRRRGEDKIRILPAPLDMVELAVDFQAQCPGPPFTVIDIQQCLDRRAVIKAVAFKVNPLKHGPAEFAPARLERGRDAPAPGRGRGERQRQAMAIGKRRLGHLSRLIFRPEAELNQPAGWPGLAPLIVAPVEREDADGQIALCQQCIDRLLFKRADHKINAVPRGLPVALDDVQGIAVIDLNLRLLAGVQVPGGQEAVTNRLRGPPARPGKRQ